MPEITLKLDASDIRQLWNTRCKWKELQFDLSRFEPHGSTPVSPDWDIAHWVGDSWATVVIFRSYLDAIHIDYQIAWDTDDGEYVVLCDHYEERKVT